MCLRSARSVAIGGWEGGSPLTLDGQPRKAPKRPAWACIVVPTTVIRLTGSRGALAVDQYPLSLPALPSRDVDVYSVCKSTYDCMCLPLLATKGVHCPLHEDGF